MDPVEQPGQPGQDPSPTPTQTSSEPSTSPPSAPPQASQPAPPQPGPAPWQNDLQQAFDPETAARVDAFLRSNVQPRMTQYEQQLAQARDAQAMYDAFQADPDAANVAVQRQLYGDQYADAVAQQLGRTDLIVGQPPAPQYQPYQAPAPQQPEPPADPYANLPPELVELAKEREEQKQQEAYDAAVNEFLSDPQYADINRDLFDPFVAGAQTWEEAVNGYRAYAAQWAQQGGEPAAAEAPPVMGSDTQGNVGSTPAQPRETLNEAIDNIFAENAPAPPVM